MTTSVPIDPEAVARRLEVLRDRIERASRGRPVEVVAVTKGFGVDAVEVALDLGLTLVGENYAQELMAKAEVVAATAPAPVWHFLGRLQRNKVRPLAPFVALWQSVDRSELLGEIARRAPGASVLVQVNLSGEPQKGGAAVDEIPGLVAHGRSLDLDVRGLMGVGPAGSPEDARPGFRALVALADQLELPVRSIGMSADVEVAVEEGATLVRVGTALFGPRPARPAAAGRRG